MARYSGIPSVPFENIDPLVSRLLMALKENVELLTNQRGELDQSSAALTAGQISVPYAVNEFTGLTAKGVGAQVESTAFPLYTDYVKALADIQTLAYDVAVLRATVNTLIAQLRNEQ